MALPDSTQGETEQLLREAILTGRLVDLRTRDGAADDPANGANWDVQRTITATVLADLLIGAEWPRPPRALRLAGARIIGRLDLGATELVFPLLLWDCWFAEPLILDDAQMPALRLPGCHMPALSAKRLTTHGNLELNLAFTAHGEVNLVGAHVGGELNLTEATITNHGNALVADGLTVDQNMFCRWFAATGQVRLLHAHIGGDLSLNGAILKERDSSGMGLFHPPALSADGLIVNQSMHCGVEFAATGEVRLPGAHIGGQLNLSGATLTNPNGHAFVAEGLTVNQGLLFRATTATGTVSLLGAKVGGHLDFTGASLTSPDGDALQLQDLQAGALVLRDLTEPPERANFTHAHVGALVDEPASWPRHVLLDGFVYDALYEEDPIAVRQRLSWLTRNPRGFSPQPYEQLAAVYRRDGREQDARTVALQKQRERRRTLGRPGRLWSKLLDMLVGYGYRTWLAGVWLVGLWLASWIVFDRAHDSHGLVLAKPDENHPGFQGAIYALDTLLPVVDLRQQNVWFPRGWVQWWASASILAGWVLTTAVVAALTGLLKRD